MSIRKCKEEWYRVSDGNKASGLVSKHQRKSQRKKKTPYVKILFKSSTKGKRIYIKLKSHKNYGDLPKIQADNS